MFDKLLFMTITFARDKIIVLTQYAPNTLLDNRMNFWTRQKTDSIFALPVSDYFPVCIVNKKKIVWTVCRMPYLFVNKDKIHAIAPQTKITAIRLAIYSLEMINKRFVYFKQFFFSTKLRWINTSN